MPSVVESSPATQPTEKKVVVGNGVDTTAEADASANLPRDDNLHVTDGRTGQSYTFPIKRNAVNAGLFKQIKSPENKEYQADQNELGLRIYDPGYGNTAVSESDVTYMFVDPDSHRSQQED